MKLYKYKCDYCDRHVYVESNQISHGRDVAACPMCIKTMPILRYNECGLEFIDSIDIKDK